MTSSQPNVPELLQRYNIRPDKRLGQNFLTDPFYLNKVVEAACVESGDCALEIGAGVGNLTRLLALQARTVVAIELDERLIPPLEEVLVPHPNVKIVHGDILGIKLSDYIDRPNYKVVANIPYYITSALIRYLLESDIKPSSLTLTVQKEVAQRICAQAGKMSLLALSVQVYGRPRIITQIPAGAFFPQPKVDSSIVRVDIYETAVIPHQTIDLFFRLAKAGFSQKRKTLRNSLSAGMHWSAQQTDHLLETAHIDPQRRPQTLSLKEWGKLTEVLIGSDSSLTWNK